MPALWWLPADPDWKQKLNAARGWEDLALLANMQLDFLQTIQIDRRLLALGTDKPDACSLPPIRLAILASSSVDQLLPGLRVAALRRGFWMTTYTANFGQYRQELLDKNSPLHRFKPDAVLFSFDAPHLLSTNPAQHGVEAEAGLNNTLRDLQGSWSMARDSFSCQVIQQTVLPTPLPLMGSNEHRFPGAPLAQIGEINHRLRIAADAERVDLMAIDQYAARDGLEAWHNPGLWHRAKQDVSPAAGPAYGELAMRVIAARRGRSSKCLVLDLDNTLWGGVIGDDGLDGIVLGQGSTLGESYIQFQNYARSLNQRGIILAVCSKNDEVNALSPFEKHPEMILKRDDIACFVANWEDKASNLRRIARQLNIGLDSLVFADDNPFERNIVRRELPMVAVPELPEDPALYARCIADGGYFEALEVTAEDRERAKLYFADQARELARENSTDLAGYLASLAMKMAWRPFDKLGLQRIVQLVNKTNQFNLVTRRYSEPEIAGLIGDKNVISLQIRLADRFGDHGVIAIIMGRLTGDGDVDIETWLMSCRVLGRGVEEACANLLADQAAKLGARALNGHYKPTAKNGMVAEHYAKLGFSLTSRAESGESSWRLQLAGYIPRQTPIEIVEG